MKQQHTVGWIPRFADAAVASTRIRCLNVLKSLRDRGIDTELFDELHFARYRAVVFVKAYDRYHYEMAQRIKSAGKRVILDLCDNHFLKVNDSPAESDRVANLARMISVAHLVVASTPTLQNVISRQDPKAANRVIVIGDAVEEGLPASSAVRAAFEHVVLGALRSFVAAQEKAGHVPLVWFGIHGGRNAAYGMNDVQIIAPELNTLARTQPLALTIISNSYRKYLRVARTFEFPTFYMPWGGSTFFQALELHRIALVPVTRNQFTDCKSNNRVALSVSRGLAVVATAIPAYEEFRPFIRLDDWTTGIREYIEHPEMAKQAAQQGQAFVKKHYSIEAISALWERVLAPGNDHDHT